MLAHTDNPAKESPRSTRETRPLTAPVEQRGWAYYAPMLAGVAVGLLAGLVYLLTLAPSVMPGDYAEFQFCAAILGVPHPTGYPLYILLGKLFTLLPFGDVAYRVNLSSAVYMAAATGVLYAIALKVLRLAGLRRIWWAAIIGAGLFAIAPTVWSMSLVARSYALNALLVSLAIFSLVSWREAGNAWWFYASCLFIGLGMVHHGTTYLLLPAYGLYLVVVEFERHRKGDERHLTLRRVLGVAWLLIGFSPMLFLVYRFLGGSPYYWGNPTTWKDFFSLITGGPFHNQVMGFGWGAQGERILFGLSELLGQYALLGMGAGIIGLAALWRYRWVEALLLTMMLLGNFLFAMNYSLVGYLYFIPTYLIWAALMAVGLAYLANVVISRAGTHIPNTHLRAGAGIVAALLLGIIAYASILRYPNIDQSGQTSTRDEVLALLSAAPPGASVYLDWEALSVVRFYRLVYGMRTDLALHSGDPGSWARGIYCDVTSGTATYVGEFAGATPPSVAEDFALEDAPMGWRVVNVRNPAFYEVPPCGACATCR